MAVIPGRVEAAQILGIAPSTLREWMAEPGFPDTSAGHDIEAIRRWRAARAKKGSETNETRLKVKTAHEAEQLKQARIKTRREQLRLEVQEGSLFPKAANCRIWTTFFTVFAEGVERIANTLPGTCGVPVKYQRALKRRLKAEHEALQQTLRDRIDADLAKLDETQGSQPDHG